MSDLIRSKAPISNSEIKFSLPEFQEFNLSNGLKIHYLFKDSLPIVQINFLNFCGAKNDLQGKSGLTTLLSLCIDEGAGEYSALKLADEFEKIGAITGSGTDQDTVYLSLLTLTENFENALKLFSLIITDPKFESEDFNREKRKLETELIRSQDQPSFLADSAFRKMAFNDSQYQYPEIGKAETIANINLSDVKNQYRNFFTPSNSEMVIIGDIRKDKLLTLLEENLNNWKYVYPKQFEFNYPKPPKRKMLLIHKEKAAQSEIRIGHLSNLRNEPDYYSKSILNATLGGQFTSRLNSNLREDKGYTYGINSAFNYYQNSAYFKVSTSVNTSVTHLAIEQMLFEIENIRNGITQKELDFSKSYLIKRYPALFETYSQLSKNIASKIIFDLPDNYFNSYISNIANVSLKDVNDAAKTRINPADLIIVVVGDKNAVKDNLEKYDFDVEVVTN